MNILKSSFSLFTLVLGFFLIVNTAQAMSINLITNGDFSTFVPSNGTGGSWTSTNIDFAGGHRTTSGNPDGKFILNDNGNPMSDPTIAQTITGLAIGALYTLSWETSLHVASASAGTGTSFGAFLDGNVLKLSENLTTTFLGDFVNFTATQTSHTISFAGELDPRTPGVSIRTDESYNLDNVSLEKISEPVAEPSTLLLLGSGLAGLGWYRRRRKVV